MLLLLLLLFLFPLSPHSPHAKNRESIGNEDNWEKSFLLFFFIHFPPPLPPLPLFPFPPPPSLPPRSIPFPPLSVSLDALFNNKPTLGDELAKFQLFHAVNRLILRGFCSSSSSFSSPSYLDSKRRFCWRWTSDLTTCSWTFII